MASYELYTYCWDSEGQEAAGFTKLYEGEPMTDEELAEWAKESAREEIKSQGGKIYHEEGNLMQYTFPEIAGMEYNEYLWVSIFDGENAYDWDLEEVKK